MSGIALLYNRRYHLNRKPDSELDPDPCRDRDRRSRHHTGRRHGHDREPQPRSPTRRNLRAGLIPLQFEDRDTTWAAIGNNSGAANREGSRQRLHPLPGVVEQARTRLLERLRGASLLRNREAPVRPGIVREELPLEELFTNSDYFESEAESDSLWVDPVIRFVQTDQSPSSSSHEVSEGKSLGRQRLQREIFRNSEEGLGVVGKSVECCICLEKFQEGDELILLNCAHRFHSVCIEPWVLTSGNCPYCRANVPF